MLKINLFSYIGKSIKGPLLKASIRTLEFYYNL